MFNVIVGFTTLVGRPAFFIGGVQLCYLYGFDTLLYKKYSLAARPNVHYSNNVHNGRGIEKASFGFSELYYTG